jgi:hypothetical protein
MRSKADVHYRHAEMNRQLTLRLLMRSRHAQLLQRVTRTPTKADRIV